MAEVIVNAVLLKLDDAALEQAVELYGRMDKVKFVNSQLEEIQGFLKDADSQRKNSEGVENWVKDVRETSFMIEDVIDTFLLKVESLNEKERTFFKKNFKWVVKKAVKRAAKNNLDKGMKKIEARFKEINATRRRFNINDMGMSSMVTMGSNSNVMISENEAIDLVGFDEEKENITDLLLDQNTLRRSVVFIAGIGGIGKTTLAEKVYQSVKDVFDFCIWLTVSKELKQLDLLRKILEKAEIEAKEEYIVTMVKKFLTGKKYLIVLDDVHSGDVWTQMAVALPDNGNGSRVLITTRNVEIAQTTEARSVCELGFLSEEESIKLLFKKALPAENFNEVSYPPDLYEVAKTASKKCGGLPLALVVVGGQLSTKPATKGAWEVVVQAMNWTTDGKYITEIFASSYEDLPVYLRSCFMYFAAFPEDHEHKAEFLTWLWIAEGFIQHNEPDTMEKTAEKYLGELAKRSMIQVSKRSPDGSILCFRVHDLLREFAIHEAKEKDFLKVLSKKDDFRDNDGSVRRVTSQLNDPSLDEKSSQQSEFTGNINSNIRSLLLFGQVIPFGSKFALLRVLVIFHYNGRIGDTFPSLLIRTLKKLLQLRCLAFIGCNFPSEVVLPIDHLQQLITLVIRSCQDIMVPPRSLWGITTLRHVFVDRAYNLCDTLEGVSKPVDVPNLQTLEEVKINKAGIELLNMPNLLKLHLINEDDSWDSIVTLLHKLGRLVSLALQSMEIPLEIIDTRMFASYECLRALYLRGRWYLEDQQLIAEMFPPHLTILTLASSHLDQKSMQVLEKLTCLRALVLEMAYAENTLICSNNGFPQLQHLILSMLKIYKLEIEEGAMPNLNHLELHSCEKMQFVPNLQHVKTLKVLSLRSMPERFKSMVKKGDNMHKIKNIRSINYYE